MGGIPEFPEYARVDRNMKDVFEQHTLAHLPYSDFNFINVVSWDVESTARVTILNDNLVICLPDYVDGTDFYSFLGDNHVEATAETLLDEAEKHTSMRKLRLVPEIGARALELGGRYEVKEDLDGHDYVISLSAIAAQHGKEFRHLRREVNFFVTNYEHDGSFKELDIRNPVVQANVAGVFMERETSKSEQQHGNAHEVELLALGRLFDHADMAEIQTFGVELLGELKAFIICEIIDKQWCVGHFWKADTAYRGIYRYLMTRTAERLVAKGMERMNIEQDLGIEGMKQMKMHLHPIERLKKYTITDRNS